MMGLVKHIFLCSLIAELIISTMSQNSGNVNTEDDADDVGVPLTAKDFEAALNIVKEGKPRNISSGQRGLIEGDIMPDPKKNGRNAGKVTKKWPGAIIPVTVSSRFSSRDRAIIAFAIEEIHNKTCIRFRARSTEQDYVHLYTSGRGCESFIGAVGGKQLLSLNLEKGCVNPGTVIHELMHAAGFYHEQSRTDRDEYVKIHWENIIEEEKHNFNKYNKYEIDDLKAEYDYCSIMHYVPTEFSKNGLPTISAIKDGKCKLGESLANGRLSDTDVRKLNTYYQCTGYPQVEASTASACKDKQPGCPRWADRGYCTQYVSYMSKNCQKSCNKCNKECVDSERDCSKWKNMGYCTKYPSWMSEHCKRSCNKCAISGGCVDLAIDCVKYFDIYCSRDSDLKTYCRKTCGRCDLRSGL